MNIWLQDFCNVQCYIINIMAYIVSSWWSKSVYNPGRMFETANRINKGKFAVTGAIQFFFPPVLIFWCFWIILCYFLKLLLFRGVPLFHCVSIWDFICLSRGSLVLSTNIIYSFVCLSAPIVFIFKNQIYSCFSILGENSKIT